LSWYFRTDGDIFLGCFFEPPAKETATGMANGHGICNGTGEKVPMPIEQMETALDWTYPWFKLTAKLHHEVRKRI
jgi:hypothetical protein